MNIYGLSTFEVVVTVLSVVTLIGSGVILLLELWQRQQSDKALREITERVEKKAPQYLAEVEAQQDLIYEIYDSFTISRYTSEKKFRREVLHLLKKVLPESKHPEVP